MDNNYKFKLNKALVTLKLKPVPNFENILRAIGIKKITVEAQFYKIYKFEAEAFSKYN